MRQNEKRWVILIMIDSINQLNLFLILTTFKFIINSSQKLLVKINRDLTGCLFPRALDAVDISWENDHLKNILGSDEYCDPDKPEKPGSSTTTTLQPYPKFNEDGQPLWHGKI